MKTNNIINLFKEKSLIIPNFLLINYKSLNINEKELIFISYLISLKELIFDIESFSNDLNYNKEEVMNIISSLEEKKLIEVVVKKENNIIKEYIALDNLYNKVLNNTLDTEEKEDTPLVYEKIEEEFGRTLSPIEYETIKRWIDSGIKEELIYEALKEAILNGVTNLKYIDKILYEWNKKGITKKSDLGKKNIKEESKELFTYDWLDSNE